ncbi:unnamed protein product [Merluccius merluccius]
MCAWRAERQAEAGDLHGRTGDDLRELLLRQEKILSNRRLLRSLPDGGRKISDFAERIRLAIVDRDAEEQRHARLFSVGTELQSKYRQAFSRQQHHGVHVDSGVSPQNRPGEGGGGGGGADAVGFALQMDTAHSDRSRVTAEAEETPDAGLSSGPDVTREGDLVRALENVTLSDTLSTGGSKDALKSDAVRDNVFLRKQPPLKPHAELMEKIEAGSVDRRHKFKPNQ